MGEVTAWYGCSARTSCSRANGFGVREFHQILRFLLHVFPCFSQKACRKSDDVEAQLEIVDSRVGRRFAFV